MHRLRLPLFAILSTFGLAAADTPTVLPPIDVNQFINLLIGPVGLTVGAIFVIWQFTSDKWLTAARADKQAQKVEDIWRERWQEMKDDRDVAIDIAEKAVGGYTSVADAIKERNKLDTLRLRTMSGGRDLPEEEIDLPPPPDPPSPVRAAIRDTERTIRRGPKVGS